MPVIRTIQTHTETAVTGAVAGEEPMQYRYGRVQFTPDRIEARYVRIDDQPWKLDTFTVSGPRLLKSGKDGQDRHENRYDSADARWREVPVWAYQWARDNAPD